jgi:hypothetical protein
MKLSKKAKSLYTATKIDTGETKLIRSTNPVKAAEIFLRELDRVHETLSDQCDIQVKVTDQKEGSVIFCVGCELIPKYYVRLAIE